MISEVQDMIRESQVDILRQRIVDGEYASLPAQEKLSWLFEAARLGKTEMLRMLAERIHGLEIRDREGEETLLHAAAESGDRETVRFCLDVLGMRLLTTDATGKSALDRVKDADRQREIFGITTEDCYQNPVVRGFHPDPSVVRVGEDYYLVNSSFAMVPALPIMHSRDLVHWTYAGHVMEDPETAGLTSLPGGFGYWAPDISFDGEKFWVVATLRRDTAPFRLQMITWARSVKGPWAPPKFLEVDGIDPSIFRDDDGQRYLVINPGVQIARLSGEGDLLEEPHMIYYGSSRKKSEGPHILKKDGYYYLLQAEGGTGRDHTETCARSRSLEGPYEPCPWNPILTCGGENSFIGRCGHGKMVELPDGRWAMVYLCGRKVEGKTLMGRETALDPVEWVDGWPMVNGLRGGSGLQKKLLEDSVESSEIPWISPRQNPKAFMRVRGEHSFIVQGGEDLTQLHGAHVILHRQAEPDIMQRVHVDVSCMQEGGFAGIAGYYDEKSYFCAGIKAGTESGGAKFVLVEQRGEERSEQVLGTIPGLQADITVTGTGLQRTVSWGEGTSYTFLAEQLTDEGCRTGKRFTGAGMGLFSTGDGECVFSDYMETGGN